MPHRQAMTQCASHADSTEFAPICQCCHTVAASAHLEWHALLVPQRILASRFGRRLYPEFVVSPRCQVPGDFGRGAAVELHGTQSAVTVAVSELAACILV